MDSLANVLRAFTLAAFGMGLLYMALFTSLLILSHPWIDSVKQSKYRMSETEKKISKRTPKSPVEPESVREAWRSMTPMCVDALADVIQNSKNDAARVAAIKTALERGWGQAHIIPSGELRPQSKIEVVFGEEPK